MTNDYMTLDPNYLVGGPMKDWKFARPIEDKIELVPKWTESYHLTGCTQNTREKQIELLTNAVNKLISK